MASEAIDLAVARTVLDLRLAGIIDNSALCDQPDEPGFVSELAAHVGLPALALAWLVYGERNSGAFTPSIGDVREFEVWEHRAAFEALYRKSMEEEAAAKEEEGKAEV